MADALRARLNSNVRAHVSRSHVRFVRKTIDGSRATYSIESEGFGEGSSGDRMCEVGDLVVDIASSAYHVVPNRRWLEANVLPPHIFQFHSDPQSLPHAGGYTCWSLSRSVNRFASECIREGKLPEQGQGAS